MKRRRNYDTKGRRQDMRKDGRHSIKIENQYPRTLEGMGDT